MLRTYRTAAVLITIAMASTISAVVAPATSAHTESDSPAALPKDEMPLRVLWSHDRRLNIQHRTPLDWPLATLAARPPLDSETINAFSEDRKLELKPAVAGQESVAVLVSPQLNTGEYWRPARMHRDEKEIAIVAESWTDNGQRRRNIRRQSLYVVSLGKLTAGDYRVTLQVRDLFQDVTKPETAGRYRERALQTALANLRVFEREPEDQARPPAITSARLKSTPGNGRLYQLDVDSWKAHRAAPDRSVSVSDDSPSATRDIALASIYSTSGQPGLKPMSAAFDEPGGEKKYREPYGYQLEQIRRGLRSGLSNVLLVRGKDITQAVKAARFAFVGGRSGERAVVEDPDAADASLWAVAYFGVSGSTPPAWLIRSVTVKEKSTVEIALSTQAAETHDLHPYLAWIPLGRAEADEYTLRLVDADTRKVTLQRTCLAGARLEADKQEPKQSGGRIR